MYDEIVPVYQAAFAGDPWFEVSKCADKLQRCVGGLSALAIGNTCDLCNSCPSRPAYERSELIERFEALAASRPVAWYAEREANELTLAAIAWQASATTIAQEKYADVPAMGDWMSGQLGDKPLIWLDEVFANRAVRMSGNLRRFGTMNRGFMEQLNNPTLAFRTKNKRMTAAAKRDFGDQATVFKRDKTVPDRRDFVIIKTNEDK